MNENIDLTKILKDCPKGTKLYSPIFGDVMFERIDDNGQYPNSLASMVRCIKKGKDPRTDKRIDFIGGIRGLEEIERRAELDMEIGFSMYPTSINELFQVADKGMLMPPKSTWFEPKLRSGLFIHRIEG